MNNATTRVVTDRETHPGKYRNPSSACVPMVNDINNYSNKNVRIYRDGKTPKVWKQDRMVG